MLFGLTAGLKPVRPAKTLNRRVVNISRKIAVLLCLDLINKHPESQSLTAQRVICKLKLDKIILYLTLISVLCLEPFI